ncbi:MAG: hypothetical protein HY735_05280 [Verrucomicrobia bacterium]|nr:hypothetical protein [Verrucomicrobiota bacterium]
MKNDDCSTHHLALLPSTSNPNAPGLNRRSFMIRSSVLAGGCALCMGSEALFAARNEPLDTKLVEIFKSCKLVLAFQKVLDEEQATVLLVDCYGSMYRKLPAFPCVGFVRLNNLGFGGICESDLSCAMTYILLQGLSGRPGFISDPTMDESVNGIILAHCLGTLKMDGPDGKSAPYRLRTIMERQEGCVPQVFMRVGQKVTQALLAEPDQLIYFTGAIIGTPDTDRSCRTKITVQVDGDATKLWQNWSRGLHRVTCYGDLTGDLRRFCRFKEIQMVNEA